MMTAHSSPRAPYVFGAHHGKWWCAPIPTFSVASLAEQLSNKAGRAVQFTTLIVDCEGCWPRFMQENQAFLTDPTLEYIFCALRPALSNDDDDGLCIFAVLP